MFQKHHDRHRGEEEGMFHKLMHGLAGSFFHSGEEGPCVDLAETRGVDIRIEKLNKSFGSNHVLKDVDPVA